MGVGCFALVPGTFSDAQSPTFQFRGERGIVYVHQYGGERDCTKYQIYFALSPNVKDNIFIICYNCNEPIVRETGERYIIVAGAYQRPLYFHDNNCYEEFLHGMVIFYREILAPDTAAETV